MPKYSIFNFAALKTVGINTASMSDAPFSDNFSVPGAETSLACASNIQLIFECQNRLKQEKIYMHKHYLVVNPYRASVSKLP